MNPAAATPVVAGLFAGQRAVFTCRCGKPVFFRNSACLACKAELGYEPDLARLSALEPTEDPQIWRLSEETAEASARYRRCANFATAAGCNWLVKVEEGSSGNGQCLCCRLDRTIPDLSIPENAASYGRICVAKRRLVALLASLGLPLASKVDADPEHGLAFDFLRSIEGGPAVMTGHADGIITLNIQEAEDAKREQIRTQLGEPYRTILGHLRHETGHYYWDRLISQTPWLEKFRSLFGDEQQDYQAALKAHYENGPAAGWQQRFVSAYASSHPWEDWAETWAHFLHILDTYATSISFGMDPSASIDIEIEPFTEESLFDPKAPGSAEFLSFLNSWIRMTAPLNELSRAMGLADFYPFVLSRCAVAKLQFIHLVIAGHQQQHAAETIPSD